MTLALRLSFAADLRHLTLKFSVSIAKSLFPVAAELDPAPYQNLKSLTLLMPGEKHWANPNANPPADVGEQTMEGVVALLKLTNNLRRLVIQGFVPLQMTLQDLPATALPQLRFYAGPAHLAPDLTFPMHPHLTSYNFTLPDSQGHYLADILQTLSDIRRRSGGGHIKELAVRLRRWDGADEVFGMIADMFGASTTNGGALKNLRILYGDGIPSEVSSRLLRVDHH